MKPLRTIPFALLAASALFAQPQGYLKNNTFYNWESAHVHPLDLTPDGTRLLAVNTANNSLEVFDTSGGALHFLQSIPTGLDPVSVRARSNSEAWVVNVISDSVSVVDLTRGLVTATIQTDDEPADVVFAGSPARAYVSCAQAKTLLVFDPASPTAPLNRVFINGEQPRALAVSKDGLRVFLAIFESGNGTTALTGGKINGFENDLVRDPRGPYGGVNVPPNNGKSFNPPMNPANPAPPPVSIIVRKNASGRWMDDNNGDWSSFVNGPFAATNTTPGARVAGWDLVDRDVAVIDTASLGVTYQTRLMNIVMAIAVNPATGEVTAVGTDAHNEIRWEPNLQGTFLRVNLARFVPGAASAISDLNPHLNYTVRNIPAASRQQSIGDPRGIVWNSAGTKAYVTGMGSNNVIAIGPSGARTGSAPIAVGQGPTGIVLNEASGRAFVLNKFDASISVVSLASEQETQRVSLSIDPTPARIKAGRPFLYNTQLTSGLGQLSCASCHVDARWDRLAWDLGNPAGNMISNGGQTFHPMKGPLLTQTLIDTMQSPFLHWRGDRTTLSDFANAFQTLMGADAPATPAQIAALQGFLENTYVVPNPYRNLDNSYPTAVNVPGPNGTIGRTGNAVLGAEEFEAGCRSCHVGHTHRGANYVDNEAFGMGQLRNPPTWRNFYRRFGFWFKDPTASTVGFGFQQDGTFDSTHNGSRSDNMMAFMFAANGSFPYEPAGLNATNYSNDTHAAVGKQVTLSAANLSDPLLTQLLALADQGEIGLVAKGSVSGLARGYAYLGNQTFQSDRRAERPTFAQLTTALQNGAVLTFTAVPNESTMRIGIDADSDGLLDRDELDNGTNPLSADLTQSNVARNAVATQVSSYDVQHGPEKAIDGNSLGYYDQNSIAHTGQVDQPWWQADLTASFRISLIQIFNRTDCCGDRLANVSVFVSNTPFASTDLAATRAQPGVTEFLLPGQAGLLPQIPMDLVGRYVRVQLAAPQMYLQLAEVKIWAAPAPAPDFTLSSSPASLSVVQGAGAGTSVSVAPLNGFTGSVSLSTGTLPVGVTASVSGNGVTFSTSANAPAGTFPISIIGTSGSLTHSTSVSLTITASADFSLSASPSAISATQGGQASTTISTTALNGFTGTATLTTGTLPTGVTASISANTVTFTTATNAPTGTFPISIIGTSGSLTHSTSVSLTITATPDFSLTAAPTGISASQGGKASTTISTTPLNGFTGAITRATGTLPTGVTASISSNQVTFAATTNAPTGTFPISITGTSGSLTHSTSVSLTINGAADFSLSASPSAISATQGGKASTTISTTPVNGFTGTVTLATGTLPAGVTASISSSIVTFTTATTAPTGTFPISITGTSGSLTHSTSVSLTITASADFSLSASPSGIAASQGGKASTTISTTPFNGFAGTITLTTGALPTGVTASISANTITFAATTNAPTGTFPISITGTSGSLTHSTSVSLTITTSADFSLSASPSAIAASQGGKTSSTISTTPLNGFTGAITLTTGTLPTGVTASISANTVTFTTATNAATGTFPISITGTSGTSTHSTSVSLTITPTATSPYLHRRFVVIDHTKVPNTDQSNFPFYFSVTDPTLKSTANGGHVTSPNGYDIVLSTDPAGATRLAHEIGQYNPATGHFSAWVNVPVLSHTADTTLYVFYGNAAVTTSQENKPAVWDANYVSIAHLPNTTGVAGSGVTSAGGAIVGTGANFDGTANAFIDLGTSTAFDLSGAFTLSTWFRKSAYTGNYEVLASKCSGAACNYELALDGSHHDLEGVQNGTIVESGAAPSLNQWHYAVEVSDGTHLSFYVDGALVATANAGTGAILAGTHFNLGREQIAGENFSGAMDEARLSKSTRSADWIATEYRNQSAPATFFALGAEDATTPPGTTAGYPNGYAHRRTVTVNHANVANTDQSGFPMLFSIADPLLKTAVNGGHVNNANGYDIVFSTDPNGAGANLAHEIGQYNASTGVFKAWVNLPTLSHTTDTTLYVFYGNPAIATSQENKAAVWDTNFVGVYHLPNNNGVTGSAVGSAGGAQVGLGATFDASANSYIDLGTSNLFDLPTAFTMSTWFKKSAYTGDYEVLMSKCNATACNYELALDGPNHDLEGVQNGTVIESGIVPSLNQWHHAVQVSDSAHLYFYLDGVLVKTAAAGTGATLPGTHFNIGREQVAGQGFSGILDEARLSKAVRSGDWILTEYRNQSNPAGFYSIGVEQ
jgi:DNA-binding beta-propeller fold protein YncE